MHGSFLYLHICYTLYIHGYNLKKKYLFLWKTVVIFEFYEQKYLEKVYLKLNSAQSTKQERSLVFPSATLP